MLSPEWLNPRVREDTMRRLFRIALLAAPAFAQDRSGTFTHSKQGIGTLIFESDSC
jgi:hypothetical protein